MKQHSINFQILFFLFVWPLILVGNAEIDGLASISDPAPRKISSLGSSVNAFGKDLKSLSEDVADRIDRIAKKNEFEFFDDPWTIQGLPLAFPSNSTGFNLGIRLLLNNMRRRDPHLWEFEIQALSSDRGRYKNFLRFDFPHAFNDKYRIGGRISYERDINYRYFGFANNSKFDPVLGDEAFLYQNVREGPSWRIEWQKYVGKKMRVGPMAGMRWVKIDYDPGSLLDQQKPLGFNGGKTHFVGLAFSYFDVDFEPYPTTGHSHDFYAALNSKIVGSDYDYARLTYTFRWYRPLHRELTFAYRSLLENVSGNVPYYEMGIVGGPHWTAALGGDRFFRGYASNLYVDSIRLIMGAELRWDPVTVYFARQNLTLGIVNFFDIGRVWGKVVPVDFTQLHPSAGFGIRLLWNKRFVIRSDFAVTPMGSSIYINLNHGL